VRDGANVGIHGSPTLIEHLLHAGLVDELRLEIYPIVAGAGARLFDGDQPSLRLRLIDTRTTLNGYLIASHRRS